MRISSLTNVFYNELVHVAGGRKWLLIFAEQLILTSWTPVTPNHYPLIGDQAYGFDDCSLLRAANHLDPAARPRRNADSYATLSLGNSPRVSLIGLQVLNVPQQAFTCKLETPTTLLHTGSAVLWIPTICVSFTLHRKQDLKESSPTQQLDTGCSSVQLRSSGWHDIKR